MSYQEAITKEELNELPLKQFDGEIVLIDNKEAAEKAAEYLSGFSYLGFDTETRPSFRKGENHKVALLQLSTADKAFLFRINQFRLPNEIFAILANGSIKKAGAAIRDDIKALQVLKTFKPAGFVELQDEAQKLGINNFSLKKMTAIVLGFKISKAQQLSNWEAPELTEAQQKYAATDAWTSYLIYEKFLNNGHGK